MTKPVKRWPIWKIAVATVGCALLAGVLLWFSLFIQPDAAADPDTPNPAMTLPSFLMMLATAAGLLSLLCLVWLMLRIRESRIPAWKRRGKKGRR